MCKILKHYFLLTTKLCLFLTCFFVVVVTTSIIDNGDLVLGENKKLFRCNSPQRITLTGTLEKTKYTMYMDMSNTQIQAFGIKDGNLSTDG